MLNDFIKRWLRRFASTIVMMSVFFAAFAGGLAFFLHEDLLRGSLALVYVLVGLVVSRLLWV